jgi:NADH-quinone oxidoreductase subunit C
MSDATTDTPPTPPPAPEVRHGALVTRSRGQVVLHPTRADYLKTVKALKTEGFAMCADLCAVDYFGASAERALPADVAAERFEVAVNLTNLSTAERVRVRVQISAEDPTVASLYDLYPGTEAMEREAFDLLGIQFTGHPDLTRILLPEDWEGHPLRKDEAQGRIPVQFKLTHLSADAKTGTTKTGTTKEVAR